MNTFDTLAHAHTDLNTEELEHLHRLTRAWGMLADLCFSDLVLFAPMSGTEAQRFVVLGQARPTTAQTFHLDVLIGRLVDEFERPMVASAWRTQDIIETDDVVLGRGERARVQCIPVRFNDKVIAIVSRESPLTVGRRPGQLERVYIETFQRFARMMAQGYFPFEKEFSDEMSARIGDGSLVLDENRQITFASPNAMNAMHRMGYLSNVIGSSLEEIGISASLIKRTFETGLPTADEIEPRLNVSLAITAVPLLTDGKTDGALVTLRDVTDIRRLDRLLISKDATIREIHHRVKNNLQTISSLLDLQSRRVTDAAARKSLDEAHRRVRSIALVHEILSRDASEQVAFNDIIDPLVRVAAHTAIVADQHVEFDVIGDAGELEAEVATPLAVVVAELLANAVEHAFNAPITEGRIHPEVKVSLENDGRNLKVVIRDNGSGLPEGFSIMKTKSLGLSIVRSLVRSQLQGSITMDNDNGTVVHLTVPIKAQG